MFAATFMFLFGPRLQVLDLHMVFVLALAGYGLIQLMGEGEYRACRVLLIAQLPALAYASGVVAWGGAGDLTMPWIIGKWMLYLLGGVGLASLYRSRGGIHWDTLVLRHVCLAALINGLFVVAVVAVAPLRSAVSGILVLDQKAHWIESGFRGFDLSMGGGASASIVFAVILVTMVRHVYVFRHGSLAAFAAAVLLMATMLTGRTGLVVVSLGVVLIATLGAFGSGSRGTSRVLSFIVTLSLMVTAVVLLLALSQTPVALHFREVVLPWALEGMIGDGASVGTNRSVNAIVQEMLFLPASDSALIFGTSNAGRSELFAYVPSDVGYVRLLFAIGAVGLAAVLAGHLPLAKRAWECRGRSPLAFGVGFYLLIMLVTNFKELHLAPRGGAAVLALWAAALWLRCAQSEDERDRFDVSAAANASARVATG